MMDPIKIEKYQAMKRYKRRRRQPLPCILKYALAVSLLGMFLSSPLWLPSLSSFIFNVALPGLGQAALGPKCVFVVANLIVIFLVGERKLLRPPATSPDIYQEYVNKQTSLRQQCEGKGKPNEDALEEEVEEGEEEMDVHGEEEELTQLNKRSEDLIARVNEQWRHEAKMLL